MKNVKSIYIKELHYYSPEELVKILDINLDLLMDVLKNLSQGDKSIVKIDKKNNKYCFNYVGIISYGDILFKCYPKYITTDNEVIIIDYLSTIIDVIEKKEIKDIAYDDFENSSSILELVIFFIKDYFNHGLYFNEKLSIKKHNQGKIDWNSTINRVDSIIFEESPFYVDFFVRKNVLDKDNYFRKLHMAILNECNSISESLELSKVIKEVSHIDQYDYLLEDFGSFNLVKQNLKKEINIQYDSRRILLLKSMLAFLEGLPAYTHNECFSTYGTNSLNLVLEKVIKNVFSDSLDQKINELISININSKYYNSKLVEIIEKPFWNMPNFNGYSKATLIPDFVKLDEEQMFIIDSKYYNLISGEYPGVSDITKQLLYKNLFNEFIQENRKIKFLGNYFAFPIEKNSNNKILDIVGTVNFTQLFGSEKIDCVFVDVNMLFKRYLNREKVNFLAELSRLL